MPPKGGICIWLCCQLVGWVISFREMTFGGHMQTYLTKEQIQDRIQALPKKSKYLTREEIAQRMNLACELGLFTKNPADLKYAVRS
jgi:hypothetical protein